MNAEELRAMQAPIKARFRDDPTSAQVVLVSRGTLDRERCACLITTGRGPVTAAGLHPLTGGSGEFACSAEMLLESLIGCAGTTVCVVCTAMGIAFTNGTIQAEGEIDFRGTMGVSREVPVGFQKITITIAMQTSADDGQLQKLEELAERYCVVAQSLQTPVTTKVVRQ